MSSEIEKQKHIETILKSLPTSAGVYRFLDQDGKIIYVGKAKNLKNRVQSYFKNDLSHSPKTRLLVKKIHDIKLVVVSSETEALLLENNFIKIRYQNNDASYMYAFDSTTAKIRFKSKKSKNIKQH